MVNTVSMRDEINDEPSPKNTGIPKPFQNALFGKHLFILRMTHSLSPPIHKFTRQGEHLRILGHHQPFS